MNLEMRKFKSGINVGQSPTAEYGGDIVRTVAKYITRRRALKILKTGEKTLQIGRNFLAIYRNNISHYDYYISHYD